jgi:sucrose-phosphate synthase
LTSQTYTSLLVCDIDNTLTGSHSGLKDLKAWLDANPETAFAIATGRTLLGTVEVIKKWDIPVPTILITAVGTEIYYSDGKNLANLTRDEAWEESWAKDWQSSDILTALAPFPRLGLQPATEQREGKLSYFLRDESLVAEIEKALAGRDLGAEVVYSHGEFLDVLPEKASKGHAVEYVAGKLGVPMDRVAAAGDSGNDLCMLLLAGRPIVVGNHSDELDPETLPRQAYFAEKPHAEGIVEGLKHAQDEAQKP